jgi:hypothetical protein
MFQCMIGGEVVKASKICTVRHDCKGMVVVFLLPFADLKSADHQDMVIGRSQLLFSPINYHC